VADGATGSYQCWPLAPWSSARSRTPTIPARGPDRAAKVLHRSGLSPGRHAVAQAGPIRRSTIRVRRRGAASCSARGSRSSRRSRRSAGFRSFHCDRRRRSILDSRCHRWSRGTRFHRLSPHSRHSDRCSRPASHRRLHAALPRLRASFRPRLHAALPRLRASFRPRHAGRPTRHDHCSSLPLPADLLEQRSGQARDAFHPSQTPETFGSGRLDVHAATGRSA